MKQATERQVDALLFILTYISENRFAPSLREIAAELKITVRSALDIVKALEKKGYIERREKISRGISVLKETVS